MLRAELPFCANLIECDLKYSLHALRLTEAVSHKCRVKRQVQNNLFIFLTTRGNRNALNLGMDSAHKRQKTKSVFASIF